MFAKFSGIILWTEKISNLQKFYEDLLGLEAHYVNDKFISFRWKDFKFSIGEHYFITNKLNKHRYRFMINFNVDEIYSTLNKLKAKNVEILREPETEHWGGILATFKDPDGNIVQIFQQP